MAFGFPLRNFEKIYLNDFDGLRRAVNRFDSSWAQFGHKRGTVFSVNKTPTGF
jgi:hypothetical protein